LLDDAVGAFLDAVTERGFDEPFLALLRAAGYEDVALVHGTQEFGKDFIAKQNGEQWVFQSKAGDINQGGWREIVGQLDELRLSNLSGPQFSMDLPRRPVLVCTGRLRGNASLLAQEYQQRARDRNEPVLEVWPRDVLVQKLSGGPGSVLAGSIDGQLLSFLGAISEQQTTMDKIEDFSRRWLSWEGRRVLGQGIIEAAICCERLRSMGRLDLACHLALSMVRAGVASPDGDKAAADIAQAATETFDEYSRSLWDECTDDLLQPRALISDSGFGALVTYPIRCLRLAETLALFALKVAPAEPVLAREVGRWLGRFVDANPAAARPISDRYAVSLVPVVLTLALCDEASVASYLRRAAIWLCDRYERGELGLASTDASIGEEIARAFGSAFDAVGLHRRPFSQIAGVLLDVAALLHLDEVYADIRNDTLAVDLSVDVLITASPDQYLRNGFGNRWDHSPDYVDRLAPDTPAAPHLAEVTELARDLTYVESWNLLAVSAILRDRHFPAAILRLSESVSL
jgi:hypothetical protein